MGSELWKEYSFGVVNTYNIIVDVWEVRNNSCPNKLQSQHLAEDLAET